MALSFLPTKEQVSALPRLAIVAYAARCASRVEPLIQNSSLKSDYKRALSEAVAVARLFAAGLADDDDARAADVAARAAYTDSPATPGVDAAARVAFAAVRSAYDDVRAADAAAIAATDTMQVAQAHAPDVIGDFLLLRFKADAECWTDSTPVPANVFGKMWPVGAPGWALASADLARPGRAGAALTAQPWFVEFLDAQGFTRTSPTTFGNGRTSIHVAGTQFAADTGSPDGLWNANLADVDPSTVKRIVLSLLKLPLAPGRSPAPREARRPG